MYKLKEIEIVDCVVDSKITTFFMGNLLVASISCIEPNRYSVYCELDGTQKNLYTTKDLTIKFVIDYINKLLGEECS